MISLLMRRFFYLIIGLLLSFFEFVCVCVLHNRILTDCHRRSPSNNKAKWIYWKPNAKRHEWKQKRSKKNTGTKCSILYKSISNLKHFCYKWFVSLRRTSANRLRFSLVFMTTTKRETRWEMINSFGTLFCVQFCTHTHTTKWWKERCNGMKTHLCSLTSTIYKNENNETHAHTQNTVKL